MIVRSKKTLLCLAIICGASFYYARYLHPHTEDSDTHDGAERIATGEGGRLPEASVEIGNRPGDLGFIADAPSVKKTNTYISGTY